MSERKIIYLVNPIAGTARKEGVKKLAEQETVAQGIAYEIYPTNVAGDYDLLRDKIERENITDIVVIGGDGTVNQVTSALRDMPVNFGIIPFGSGNGLALSAGIPIEPKAALELVLKGQAKKTDAFLVNDHYSCMLSGVGLDAQVAHDFATKETRGLRVYTQQSILNYFKAQPYPFEIFIDNFSFFSDAFFISIANSNQFGNNVTIAPQASLNDGLLDVVIVQKMSKAKLPFAMLKHLKGNNKLQELTENKKDNSILYFQTPSLTIKNLKLAPLHIDGEPRETTEELNFSILRDCFNLIQP